MSARCQTLVIEIKGNSLDDGPGIRSVVFFKGCPLSCAWCHNPESRSRGAELSWDPSLCVACGTCSETCSSGAIVMAGESRVDRTQCRSCFSCAAGCPSGALRRVGAPMTRQQIVERVLRDKPFYDASGGGVTLSGGEPTLHMELVSEVARELRANGVHVLLETCGFFRLDAFTALLLPHLDAVYMDLKLIDPAQHRRWCGVDNRIVLENFAALAARARGGAFELSARTPLIPGITDTPANLAGIARFLAGLEVRTLHLLPNNPTWQGKSHGIGVDVSEGLGDSLRRFLSSQEIAICHDLVAAQGVEAACPGVGPL
jgi:pyruvate formate lyase activating enzyme